MNIVELLNRVSVESGIYQFNKPTSTNPIKQFNSSTLQHNISIH